MTYTVWMHGRKIGETRFELSEHFQRRVGAFQPTAHGLTVLPGITNMFPALLDFADMCHRQGFDVNDDWCEAVSDTASAFSDTPEGQRVLEAAERISEVQVRDPAGRVISWESLAISELDMLMPVAAAARSDLDPRMTQLKYDPVQYMISMTLPSDSPNAGAGLFKRVRHHRRAPRGHVVWQDVRDTMDPRGMA